MSGLRTKEIVFSAAALVVCGLESSFAAAPTIRYIDIQFSAFVGNCLDANTGQSGVTTYMRPCDNKGNANLRWDAVRVANGFQLRTRTTGFCLDANTGALGSLTYMRECDSGENSNLVWRFVSMGVGQGFHIRSLTTDACLDANSGALGSPTYMNQCDTGGNPNLRWRMQE